MGELRKITPREWDDAMGFNKRKMHRRIVSYTEGELVPDDAMSIGNVVVPNGDTSGGRLTVNVNHYFLVWVEVEDGDTA